MEEDCMRHIISTFTALVLLLIPLTNANGLEVTLNIKGSLEEIEKVLHCIQQSGLGVSTQSETDPFRVHIYSSNEVVSKEEKENLSVGFIEIRTEPEQPVAGTPFKLTAKIIDNLNVIDTVSVNIFGTTLSLDLKDDGQNGDDIAGDGIWTGIFNLPPDVKGNKTFLLTAFDEKGKIIQLKMNDGTIKPIMGTYECLIQSPDQNQH